MEKDLGTWIDDIGIEFFRKIGISSGDEVLDFGCGWGSNSVAISKIIYPAGTVYALERDKDSIKKIYELAGKKDLENIKIIKAKNKIMIPLGDDRLDSVLLYDVIHDYYFNRKQRLELFKEAQRTLKQGGLLSVFPHHITDGEFIKIKDDIINSGFDFRDMIKDNIIHDSILIEDKIYNFTKD